MGRTPQEMDEAGHGVPDDGTADPMRKRYPSILDHEKPVGIALSEAGMGAAIGWPIPEK